jgi:hypothetical protein
MYFHDRVLIDENLRQFKGNLHSHTVNSDGCLTPAQSAELFREHGYDFLCFSEHDRYTDYREQFNDDGFIILPAIEASAILYADGEHKNRLKVHHMLGILGTEQMQKAAPEHFHHMEFLQPPVYCGEWDGAAAAQKVCNTLRAHGCMVVYNHPIWSRVSLQEFDHTEGVTALEIYNYGTVNESGTGYDVTFWDQILRDGRQIFATAADDNHNDGAFPDACGGWIQVQAPALTQDDIITAIMNGRYYSSSGPRIDSLKIKGDAVKVKCSPCERVNFICGGFINAGTTVLAGKAGTIEEAEFALKGNEQYVRAECVDAKGRTAWSNAVFLM